MNPYDILGVSPAASDAEIKRAYRDLVKKFHPDRNPSPEAKLLIVQINEAYDILADPERRRVYNQGSFQEVVEETYEEDPREVYRREYIRQQQEQEREARELRLKWAKRWFRFAWWMSIPLLAFSVFLIVDGHLPSREFDETVKYGDQQMVRTRRHYSLISFMVTDNFTIVVPQDVHLHYPYHDENRPKLHIETTPLQKIIKRVSLKLNGEIVVLETEKNLYSIFIPFHYLLFFSALFTAWRKEYSPLNYVFCGLPILFAVIVAVIRT